jgi:hypothetical protein
MKEILTEQIAKLNTKLGDKVELLLNSENMRKTLVRTLVKDKYNPKAASPEMIAKYIKMHGANSYELDPRKIINPLDKEHKPYLTNKEFDAIKTYVLSGMITYKTDTAQTPVLNDIKFDPTLTTKEVESKKSDLLRQARYYKKALSTVEDNKHKFQKYLEKLAEGIANRKIIEKFEAAFINQYSRVIGKELKNFVPVTTDENGVELLAIGYPVEDKIDGGTMIKQFSVSTMNARKRKYRDNMTEYSKAKMERFRQLMLLNMFRPIYEATDAKVESYVNRIASLDASPKLKGIGGAKVKDKKMKVAVRGKSLPESLNKLKQELSTVPLNIGGDVNTALKSYSQDKDGNTIIKDVKRSSISGIFGSAKLGFLYFDRDISFDLLVHGLEQLGFLKCATPTDKYMLQVMNRASDNLTVYVRDIPENVVSDYAGLTISLDPSI